MLIDIIKSIRIDPNLKLLWQYTLYWIHFIIFITFFFYPYISSSFHFVNSLFRPKYDLVAIYKWPLIGQGEGI